MSRAKKSTPTTLAVRESGAPSERGLDEEEPERSALYHGPMPPPAMVREYEEIVPGAAERIFKAFELEGDHRRKLEVADQGDDHKLVEAAIKGQARGQWMAYSLAICAMGISLVLAMRGAAWYAIAASSLPFGGIAALGLTLFKKKPHEHAAEKKE